MRTFLVMVAAAVAVAGCSSSSSSSSSSSAAAEAPPATIATTSTTAGASAFSAIGAATATGTTLSLAKSSQGIFLIGPNGHALYVFAKDQGTTSACTAACAKTWPALTATGALTEGPLVTASEVTTANGQVANQVTYYGHLLYYFSGDSAPGETNGVGIPNWNLLGPRGNVMLPR